jgi:hypothetical protein
MIGMEGQTMWGSRVAARTHIRQESQQLGVSWFGSCLATDRGAPP